MSQDQLPRKGALVLTSDGEEIGTIREVLYQPALSTITKAGYHLQVTADALAPAQELFIPVEQIAFMREETVYLSADRATVAGAGWETRPDGLEPDISEPKGPQPHI